MPVGVGVLVGVAVLVGVGVGGVPVGVEVGVGVCVGVAVGVLVGVGVGVGEPVVLEVRRRMATSFDDSLHEPGAPEELMYVRPVSCGPYLSRGRG